MRLGWLLWESPREVKRCSERFLPPLRAAVVAVVAFTILAAPQAAGANGSDRYGGLGATISAFYAQNPHGSGTPPLGVVYYYVDVISNGRVSAFHIVINARPAFSARERVVQVGGIGLPDDATETSLNSSHCLVWHSRKLGKLLGMSYAAATTGSDQTMAEMRAESKPHC